MATKTVVSDDHSESFMKTCLQAFQRRMRIRREEKELMRALRLDWLNQWPIRTNRVDIEQLDVENNYPTLMAEYRKRLLKQRPLQGATGRKRRML